MVLARQAINRTRSRGDTHVPLRIFGLVSIALITLSACAGHPDRPVQLDEGLLARLKVVGVASAKTSPIVKITVPAKGAGEGAERGAAQGAGASVVGGGLAGPLGLIVGVVLAPVAGAVGAGAGAANALPEETVVAAEKVVNKTIRSTDIQVALRDRVARAIREDTGRTVIIMLEQGPSKDETTPSYRSIKTNVDAVLEVAVTHLALGGGALAINPPMKFVMRATSRLVDPNDNAVLYTQSVLFDTEPRNFLEWAKEDGVALKTQIKSAIDTLAEQIVDDMFLNQRPPTERPNAGS